MTACGVKTANPTPELKSRWEFCIVVDIPGEEFATISISIDSNGVCGIPGANTVVHDSFVIDSGGSPRATVDCDFYTIRFRIINRIRIIKLSHQWLLILI